MILFPFTNRNVGYMKMTRVLNRSRAEGFKWCPVMSASSQKSEWNIIWTARVKDKTRIFISTDEDKHLDIEIKIEIYFQRYIYLKIDLKDINKDIKYYNFKK